MYKSLMHGILDMIANNKEVLFEKLLFRSLFQHSNDTMLALCVIAGLLLLLILVGLVIWKLKKKQSQYPFLYILKK